MKQNNRRKSKDKSKKREQTPKFNQEKLIKFNLSYDNLKCFINDKHPKTERQHITNRYNFNLTNTKKYKDDRDPNDESVGQRIQRDGSPDPSRQASNSIIEEIQRKGLFCPWSQIQQTKTQYSNEDQDNYKEFLHQPFSQCSSSYKKNNSYASTVDRFSGYYPQSMNRYSQTQLLVPRQPDFLGQTTLATSEYITNDRNKYYETSVFQIDCLNIGKDPRTTLMIKNIPNKYTIQDLSYEIDHDFYNSYDFLYLPCDIKNNCNVGYGFINFVDTEVLHDFYKQFHNKKWSKFRSQKICVLTYARLQGLSSLIEHFQNSKVLNHKDKRYQPIIRQIRECKKIQSLINQQKNQQSNFKA